MTDEYSEVVTIARDYYNSEDADNFYYIIWGGEDIHIGTYNSEKESIFDASRRTVEDMASKLHGLSENSKVLDIGSGYGGSARYLAEKFGCHVTALNLSEVENNRNREMNKQQDLDASIEVVDGNFESLPFDDNSFDFIWSQDAILHSGDKAKVLSEVNRVLKSGGEFIFTDPMQADSCPDGVLQPILDRIHLDTLGSPGLYREFAKGSGMEEVAYIDRTSQLVTHYSRVLEETEARENELDGIVTKEYIERMKKGLRHWIEGGNNGYLAWGILHFKKN